MRIIFLLCTLILAGCSTLNENFDCPAPQGGSCKRMDEVYESINGAKQQPTPALSLNSYISKEQGAQRIWVAPYEDREGTYHPSKGIYSALRD